ncbi:hypothetical protein V7139_06145 [Neobacillus drentensis]
MLLWKVILASPPLAGNMVRWIVCLVEVADKWGKVEEKNEKRPI